MWKSGGFLGLVVTAACTVASSRAVLKTPAQNRCEEIGLRGCPEIADGVVAYTFDETQPGDPCHGGGGSECAAFSNYVTLLHGDGTTTIYKHLNAVLVAVGELVPRACVIGLSGTTGWSTGPHLHAMRQEDCGEANCQSIPLAFVDVPGDGVPVNDQDVVSDNCPE